jgi:DNA segregation ATPase FtsK/SpoIIIE-like protein
VSEEGETPITAEAAPKSRRRFARLDTNTGEIMEDDAEVTATPAEEPEAEPVTALPFYESSVSRDTADDKPPFDVDEPEEDDADGAVTANDYEDDGESDTAARRRATTLFLPDEGRRSVPEDTEDMEVDYDDDYESEDDGEQSAVPSYGVGYEVVTAAEQAPAKSDTPVTTVRILKTDTSALTDSGLSDEEVVHLSDLTSGVGGPEGDSEEDAVEAEYLFPPADLLIRGPSRYEANDEEIAANTQLLREVLESFHIRVKEISCSCGPTITRFEVKPESGIRVRAIANLVDDICMNLAKAGVRIEAPIPG